MIGADVGHDADVVAVVADPAQQDAAARGLQDGDVEPRLGEHARRAAEARPVPRLDEAAVDVDAVRVGHAHPPAGRGQEVGDEARGGALPVRAGDGDDRQGRDGQRRPRAVGDGPKAGELAAPRAAAQRDARRCAADRLADRAPPPWERDHGTQVVDAAPEREPRRLELQRGVQRADRLAGARRGLGGEARLSAANSTLTAGRLKKRFGPSSTRSSVSSVESASGEPASGMGGV